MRPLFTTIVDRLCRVRRESDTDDVPFPLSEDGFLDSSAPRVLSAETLIPGALVLPSVVVGAGALVLLGEPGLGKTTVLEQLCGGVGEDSARAAQPKLVRVDAADLTGGSFEEVLGRHLRDLPDMRNPYPNTASVTAEQAGGAGAYLTVVIDQLDESPIVRRLPKLLRAALKSRDTSELRLLVACRTADYPSDLTEVLESACRGCVFADLAPLTREDAVELASSVDGVDGEALIAEAVQSGAGVLASVPLTLDLLIRTRQQTGTLNAHPRRLFTSGVIQLIQEPDHGRLDVDEEVGAAQRLAVAERIAAWLLLSDRRTIWRGPVLEAGEQDLNADLLAAGSETTEAGSAFEVTNPMVLTTLGTGLFTGRGKHRLAFRHGSFGAFLAARYLIRREIPVIQLKALFLVAGGDQTRSVPPLLREAAAWLVTLAPQHGAWLAEADPESLAGYSPIVDSDHVRALIVEALLNRASEIELGDRSWTRSRLRLQHPGLEDQLLAVLSATGGREPQDWEQFARVRLAVRLAQEIRTPGLALPLLGLADDDTWSPHMRQLAVRAGFNADRGRAVPRLVALLARLADSGYSHRVDPDDELRGTLLKMLWPCHITTAELLPHLRPRGNRNLLGSFLIFERTFAPQLPEQDLGDVLIWAAGVRVQIEDDLRTPPDPSESLSERPVGGLDTEVIEALVDRAFASSTALEHVDAVAALVFPRLRRFDRPPLPAAADLLDDSDREPPDTRMLRRALARSLAEFVIAGPDAVFVQGRGFTLADANAIVWGWGPAPRGWSTGPPLIPEGFHRADRQGLLDAADFEWLYHAAGQAEQDGHHHLADALGQIASQLFDLTQPALAELVYADQKHPVWPHVRHWFRPVEITSVLAAAMRRNHSYRPNTGLKRKRL